MGVEKTFKELVEVMAHLRGPEGCPWDREQTHDSVIPYLIEEACEACEALSERDWNAFKEELGDILCQVIFHAQIAEQDKRFTIEDICCSLKEKLIRRHPHVFANTQVNGADDVLKNWEKIKQTEKEEKKSVLSGVPRSLPALMRAYRIGQKASRVGFEFPNLKEVFRKVDEELSELKKEIPKSPDATDEEALFHEMGDLFFSLVNVARHLKINPEMALQETTRRFQGRFEFIESELKKQGKSFEKATLEEMDALWEKAKKE